MKIYDLSDKVFIPSDTIVFDQGLNVDHIYVVLKGKLMVARTFNIPRKNEHYGKVGGNISQLNVKDKYIIEPKTLQIDRIGQKDMIGDYCFVFKEPLPYTIVTLYPTKLLRVPLDELKVRFSDQ